MQVSNIDNICIFKTFFLISPIVMTLDYIYLILLNVYLCSTQKTWWNDPKPVADPNQNRVNNGGSQISRGQNPSWNNAPKAWPNSQATGWSGTANGKSNIRKRRWNRPMSNSNVWDRPANPNKAHRWGQPPPTNNRPWNPNRNNQPARGLFRQNVNKPAGTSPSWKRKPDIPWNKPLHRQNNLMPPKQNRGNPWGQPGPYKAASPRQPWHQHPKPRIRAKGWPSTGSQDLWTDQGITHNMPTTTSRPPLHSWPNVPLNNLPKGPRHLQGRHPVRDRPGQRRLPHQSNHASNVPIPRANNYHPFRNNYPPRPPTTYPKRPIPSTVRKGVFPPRNVPINYKRPVRRLTRPPPPQNRHNGRLGIPVQQERSNKQDPYRHNPRQRIHKKNHIPDRQPFDSPKNNIPRPQGPPTLGRFQTNPTHVDRMHVSTSDRKVKHYPAIESNLQPPRTSDRTGINTIDSKINKITPVPLETVQGTVAMQHIRSTFRSNSDKGYNFNVAPVRLTSAPVTDAVTFYETNTKSPVVELIQKVGNLKLTRSQDPILNRLQEPNSNHKKQLGSGTSQTSQLNHHPQTSRQTQNKTYANQNTKKTEARNSTVHHDIKSINTANVSEIKGGQKEIVIAKQGKSQQRNAKSTSFVQNKTDFEAAIVHQSNTNIKENKHKTKGKPESVVKGHEQMSPISSDRDPHIGKEKYTSNQKNAQSRKQGHNIIASAVKKEKSAAKGTTGHSLDRSNSKIKLRKQDINHDRQGTMSLEQKASPSAQVNVNSLLEDVHKANQAERHKPRHKQQNIGHGMHEARPSSLGEANLPFDSSRDLNQIEKQIINPTHPNPASVGQEGISTARGNTDSRMESGYDTATQNQRHHQKYDIPQHEIDPNMNRRVGDAMPNHGLSSGSERQQLYLKPVPGPPALGIQRSSNSKGTFGANGEITNPPHILDGPPTPKLPHPSDLWGKTSVQQPGPSIHDLHSHSWGKNVPTSLPNNYQPRDLRPHGYGSNYVDNFNPQPQSLTADIPIPDPSMYQSQSHPGYHNEAYHNTQPPNPHGSYPPDPNYPAYPYNHGSYPGDSMNSAPYYTDPNAPPETYFQNEPPLSQPYPYGNHASMQPPIQFSRKTTQPPSDDDGNDKTAKSTKKGNGPWGDPHWNGHMSPTQPPPFGNYNSYPPPNMPHGPPAPHAMPYGNQAPRFDAPRFTQYTIRYPDGSTSREEFSEVTPSVQRIVNYVYNNELRDYKIADYFVMDRTTDSFAIRAAKDMCYVGNLDSAILDSFTKYTQKTRNTSVPIIYSNNKLFFFKEIEQVLFSDVNTTSGEYIAGSCGDAFMFRVRMIKPREIHLRNGTVLPGNTCPFGEPLKGGKYGMVTECQGGYCPSRDHTCKTKHNICCPKMPKTTRCMSISIGKFCVTYSPHNIIIN